MRVVIVYESMFGNTRLIAEAIAKGFGDETDVQVFGVADADPKVVEDADLIVVGGPTHAWDVPAEHPERCPRLYTQAGERPCARARRQHRTRRTGVAGIRWPARDESSWLRHPIQGPSRVNRPRLQGIDRELSRQGFIVVAPAESFLVNKKDHLLLGETDRGRLGALLATTVERLQTATT